MYEEYQQARDTLANINLPKSAHNLHPLEVAFTACAEGKKRQKTVSWSNFTPSPLPTSTIEEVDNEDTISLGSNIGMTMEDIWDSVNEHLGLDMMDPIIFRTFNEFRVKTGQFFHHRTAYMMLKFHYQCPLLKGCRRLKNYLIMMLMYIS